MAQSTNEEVPRPTAERLRDLDHKFWTWCWYGFGKIVRGELWEAVDGLHVMRTRALVPLIAWAAGAPTEGYRRLEQKADARLLARLGRTAAPPDRPALYGALQEAMALYAALRAPLLAELGIQVDGEAERVLRDAVAEHWAART